VGIPVIERVKIQAQVLVPLVKALQAELGEERANALVRKALGDVYRRLGEQWWQSKQSTHVGENMAPAFDSFARGDALDYSVRAQSQEDACTVLGSRRGNERLRRPLWVMNVAFATSVGW
jgi:L-2-amino-thiazoline-4-carboxylic acid hydrolase-like protein